MKRFFLTMMSVALAAVLFSSCESKVESDHVDRLPGDWVITNVYPDAAAKYLKVGDTITFSEDNKVKLYDSMYDVFTDLRWVYEADFETGAYLYVMGEDKTPSTNTIVLMYGRIMTMSDQYMRLAYDADTEDVTYTYELKRK